MRGRCAAGDSLAVPDPHRSARTQWHARRRLCPWIGLGAHATIQAATGRSGGSRGHGIADTGAPSLEVSARALSARRAARDVPRDRAQSVHRVAAAESPPGPSRRPPPTTPRPARGRGPRRGRHQPCIAGAGTWRGPGSRAPSRAARAERETLRRAAVRARALTAPELQQLRSCELAAHHRRASGRQLTRASALDAGGQAGAHARVTIE